MSEWTAEITIETLAPLDESTLAARCARTFPLASAAEILGVSRQRVHQLGNLKATIISCHDNPRCGGDAEPLAVWRSLSAGGRRRRGARREVR